MAGLVQWAIQFSTERGGGYSRRNGASPAVDLQLPSVQLLIFCKTCVTSHFAVGCMQRSDISNYFSDSLVLRGSTLDEKGHKINLTARSGSSNSDTLLTGALRSRLPRFLRPGNI